MAAAAADIDDSTKLNALAFRFKNTTLYLPEWPESVYPNLLINFVFRRSARWKKADIPPDGTRRVIVGCLVFSCLVLSPRAIVPFDSVLHASTDLTSACLLLVQLVQGACSVSHVWSQPNSRRRRRVRGEPDFQTISGYD